MNAFALFETLYIVCNKTYVNNLLCFWYVIAKRGRIPA